MRGNRSNRGLRYNGVSVRVWGGLLLFALAMLAVIEYREGRHLLGGLPIVEPFVFRLAGYANLLLGGAAVLYVVHTWVRSDSFGRWASALAAVGAATALTALVVRWIETYYLQRPGHVPLDSLYEMVALFNALTVVLYLVMERVYRSRSAGAFVMLIVLAAVLFQIWLLSQDQDAPGSRAGALRYYAVHAHVLGSFIGYAAFAAAAAMAGATLLQALGLSQRARLQARLHFAPFSRTELRRYARLMHQAVLFGFCSFSIATALGVLSAWDAWNGYGVWAVRESWALVVWLAYAAYFWLRNARQWRPTSLARWVLCAFAVALTCLVIARVLAANGHALASHAF